MSATAFLVLLFLPSMAFAFVALATFYGVRRAYLALSWVPLCFFVLVYVLQQLLLFQHEASAWPQTLFQVVRWVSLIQLSGGIVLAVWTYRQKQGWLGLAAAAVLAGLPFILRP